MNTSTITELKKQKVHSTRFIELDLFRGCAIIAMIFLHLLWDLDYFGLVPLNRDIYRFQAAVPTLFFILVGICVAITINKVQTSSGKTLNNRLFFRGLWIFGLGMVLTAITLLVMPDRPIFFGVLHCIGLSIILSIPFLRLKTYNVVFAVAIIFLGFIMGTYTIEQPTIAHLVLGVHQADIARYTIDYFPLFPWFGVCLLGIALGNILYRGNERRFPIPDLSSYKPVKLFSWLGRHSLTIYLFHQPIIAGIILLFVIL